VLTRRASAIETLGAASVLCTDKTGTLTENRMTIAELRLPDGTAAKAGAALPEAFRELAAAGVMASAPDPFDPMEKAFHVLAKADLRDGETPPGAGRQLVRSYPLSPELLAMSQAWAADTGWQIAAKGAPEAMAVLCRMDDAARALLTAQVDQMAGAGLRVLGVAEASQTGALPDDPAISAFRFLGLVGLADPCAPRSPRPSPSAAARVSGSS
jgi:P-type Ca2+ transporter type 2C